MIYRFVKPLSPFYTALAYCLVGTPFQKDETCLKEGSFKNQEKWNVDTFVVKKSDNIFWVRAFDMGRSRHWKQQNYFVRPRWTRRFLSTCQSDRADSQALF